MGPQLTVALCVVGAVVSPLVLVLVASFVYAFVKTVRFKRKKGWLADQVPHTELYEYYHASSIDMDAQKILCCLAEKGVEFKEREVDLGVFGRFEHLEDTMLRINPNGTQPTLVHDGHPVIGIEEIVGYMEEHIPGPPMLPADTEERQEVIRWIQVCSHAPAQAADSKEGGPVKWSLGMVVRLLSLPVVTRVTKDCTVSTALWAVWRHPNPLPEVPKVTWALTRHFRQRENVPPSKTTRQCFAVLAETMGLLEKQLAKEGRTFLVGSSFTLADACLAAYLSRLEKLGLLELILGDTHPKTKEYWERIQKRDSCRRAFWPKPVFPGLEELEQAFARFRELVAERGLSVAFRMDEDKDEEEED